MVISGSYAAALVEWRERVGEIYKQVRANHAKDARRAWEKFRQERDELYKHHRCSALSEPEKLRFSAFPNYNYDPRFCFTGAVEYAVDETEHTAHLSEGLLTYRKIARANFRYRRKAHTLSIFWLDIYGGGIWIPIGDETNGDTTYGGGRYLFDTTKNADLGINKDGRTILLDMNFLYPPSCSLNSQWVCPLCPPENKLPIRIQAGEMNMVTGAAQAIDRAAE
jgi:uncharacterized protein (DUF1684 family)